MRGGTAVFPILLGTWARAGADVWIYAFLPVYLHMHLHEQRLWIVTLALAVPAVVRWVMSPIWGRAADRSARPARLLVVGLLGYSGLLLGIPHLASPAAVVGLVALTTTFSSSFNPVARALVTMHDTDRSLLNLASWHQWEAAGYLLAGLTLGAAMNDTATFSLLTTTTALILAVCALWVTLQPAEPASRSEQSSPQNWTAANTRQQEKRHTTGRHATGFRRWLPRSSSSELYAPLRWSLLFLFVASFVWEAVAGIFGLYFTQSVHGSLSTYGLIISASTALSFLIYKPLARYGDNTSTARLFGMTALSGTIMYGLMSVPTPLSAAISYMVPFNTIARTAFNALLVNNVATTRRGEFLGIMEATESAAAVFGPLAGGIGADRFGLGAIPIFALWGSFTLHLLVTRLTARSIV